MERNIRRNERFPAVVPLLLTLSLLSGCSVVNVDSPADTPRYYFGFIKLSSAAQNTSKNAPTSNTIQMWGIRVKDALTVGYANESVVRVPMDCRIMFFIRSAQELEQARQLLDEIKGDELFIIQTQG